MTDGRAEVPRTLRWSGCSLSAWLRLLGRQQYAFDRALWPAVLRTTVGCAAVSALGFVQDLLYDAEVRRTVIRPAPLFVLGHWRSGTTYLHDLLSLDERHTFATNLDCFAADHFLLTGDWIRRWKGTAEHARPMDNVKMGLNTPQEDEFALCMMGVPSPYLDAAFPNRPLAYQDYLDLENVPAHARAAWERGLVKFMKRLLYRKPGRLILKSPTHTARVKILRELFPDANFVHIVRNPYVVFPSTRKTFLALWKEMSLQPAPYPGLDDFIFDNYVRLMTRLEEGRSQVDPKHFYEVRYEDVAADPVGQVRAIYEHFRLGGFERLQPRLEKYLAELGPYQVNRHHLPPELHAAITKRWRPFIEKYGYADEAPATAPRFRA